MIIWFIIFVSSYYLLSNFCKKSILGCLNETEFTLGMGIFFAINLIGFFLFKKYYKKEEINLFSKLISNKKIIIFIILLTSFKYIMLTKKAKYIKNNDFGKVVPMIKSLGLLIAFLISIYVYKEEKKLLDFIAFGFILIGFILFQL